MVTRLRGQTAGPSWEVLTLTGAARRKKKLQWPALAVRQEVVVVVRDNLDEALPLNPPAWSAAVVGKMRRLQRASLTLAVTVLQSPHSLPLD